MIQHSEPKEIEEEKFQIAKEQPTQGILSDLT